MREYIQDTVGQFIKLSPIGNRFVGLCPFHMEKTPSFTVDPLSNTYHCFGCESHGHVEDFAEAFGKVVRAA